MATLREEGLKALLGDVTGTEVIDAKTTLLSALPLLTETLIDMALFETDKRVKVRALELALSHAISVGQRGEDFEEEESLLHDDVLSAEIEKEAKRLLEARGTTGGSK